MNYYGVVRHTYAYIIIFDREHGRRVVRKPTYKHFFIVDGAYIEYSIRTHKHLHIIERCNMLHESFAIARHDVPFFKTLLQICFDYAPEGIENRELFKLLHTILFMHNHILPDTSKLIIVLKALWCLDIYSPKMLNHKKFMNYLHSVSGKDILEKRSDLVSNKVLQDWIATSTQQKYNKD